MPRVEDDKLINMALAVLEEATARARFGPQKRTRGIALALAYLGSRCPEVGLYSFSMFWKCLDSADLRGRTQMLMHSLEWIYGDLGMSRDYGAVKRLVDKIAVELGQNDTTGSSI